MLPGNSGPLAGSVRQSVRGSGIVDLDQRPVAGECLRKIAGKLKRGGNGGEGGDRKPLAQSLIVAEEEPLALQDRPARVGAELVALKRRFLLPAAVVEEVVRIETLWRSKS